MPLYMFDHTTDVYLLKKDHCTMALDVTVFMPVVRNVCLLQDPLYAVDWVVLLLRIREVPRDDVCLLKFLLIFLKFSKKFPG
jgi:hypothetical protein